MTLTLRQIKESYKKKYGEAIPDEMSYMEAVTKLKTDLGGLEQLSEFAAEFVELPNDDPEESE